MKIFVIIIAFAGLSLTYAQSAGECVPTPILNDFNPSRYFGKWYEIERFDFIFERDLTCVTAEYSQLNETTFNVINSGFNTKKQKTDVVKGYAFVADPKIPNKLIVALPVNILDITSFTNNGKYDVIATDYENYSLVYSCSQVIPKLLKFEITWILSRSKTLDSKIIDNLKSIAKEYKIDVTKFIPTDQSCN